MQTNRVLLAHSDPVVQELAARALTRFGATLDIAPDPADAISRIGRESYAVITLQRDDAVIAAIAAHHAHKPRPVVIVTAEDSRELDATVVSLVVPEPFDAHTLVGVILACVTPGNAPIESALPGDLLHDL